MQFLYPSHGVGITVEQEAYIFQERVQLLHPIRIHNIIELYPTLNRTMKVQIFLGSLCVIDVTVAWLTSNEFERVQFPYYAH